MNSARDVEHGVDDSRPNEETQSTSQIIRLPTRQPTAHAPIEKLGMVCRPTVKGWWIYSVQTGPYEDDHVFSFKLTEERDQEFVNVKELHVVVSRSDGHDSNELQLLDVLKDTTHWSLTISDSTPSEEMIEWLLDNVSRAPPVPGRLVARRIAEFLKTADKSVSLESLDFRGQCLNEKVEETRSIFEAMESGKLIRLKSLFLNNLSVGDADLECMARGLKAGFCPSLSKLALGNNRISSEGWKCVAASLKYVSGLQLLDLQSNYHQSKSGHVALAKALKSCHLPALKTLNLYGTEMGDEGCEAYAKAISVRSLPALEDVDFGRNGIRARGGAALAHALRSGSMSSLARIALGRNYGIGHEPLLSSTTLNAVPNLLYLDLRETCLSELGFLSLSSALAVGSLNSLKELNLLYNKPTEGSARALVAALASNDVLKLSISFEWNKFPELARVKDHVLKRNQRVAEILPDLGRWVPASVGKVYLCGNPMVGKTTLRKSLQRSFWEALCMWERRPSEENRTRGIDVSQMVSKGKLGDKTVTLMMWDMAGQNEYHLVHNAFFPDLAVGGGKATTFLVVCSSPVKKEVEQELDYWLRFISCSCAKNVGSSRYVLVIRNLRKGEEDFCDAQWWEELLKFQKDRFQDYLIIETKPFLLDVRKRRFVRGLRKCLMHQAKQNLANETIPEVCQFIQRNLSAWSKKEKQFPLMQWDAFRNKLWLQFVKDSSKKWWMRIMIRRLRIEENSPTDNLLEAAVRYMNEVGIVLHIHTKFPSDWSVSNKRLVVVQPNWFLKEIAGSVFLPTSMAIRGEIVFRDKVDHKTGSISLSDFHGFFTEGKLSEWVGYGSHDLIAILLWLGLCYVGHQDNIFFPALIAEDGTNVEFWEKSLEYDDIDGQWVMGYSVEQKKGEIGLAPLSLWHKLQVELAQTSKYNGLKENNFVTGKHFVTFMVDHMVVLIEVNANIMRPTFDRVDIFVKPLWENSKDPLSNLEKRKECQVDLAGELIETLLRLWNQICPGLPYLQRVVWPWPVSYPRPATHDKNLEVKEVEELVEKQGPSRLMMWKVGSEGIRGEQLLSRKETKDTLESIKGRVHQMKDSLEEAVALGIFSSDILKESKENHKSTSKSYEASISSQRACKMAYGLLESEISSIIAIHQDNEYRKQVDNVVVKEMVEEVDDLANQGPDDTPLAQVLKEMRAGFRGVDTGLQVIRSDIRSGFGDVDTSIVGLGSEVRSGLSKVLHVQETLIGKVRKELRDIEKLFLEDRERSCPRFIYPGRKHSGTWMTLKEVLSLSLKVHVHFLCEAKYNDYARHEVDGQEGLDVSHLKDWVKKILPLLKVSVAILFFSAKVGANVVAPGLGMAIPDFAWWQQAVTFSESIASATGYSNRELGKLEEADFSGNKVIQSGVGVTPERPHELHGDCRKAMTELLGKLSSKDYEDRLGLRKVFLKYPNGSSEVVWICTDCYKKFRKEMPDHVNEL